MYMFVICIKFKGYTNDGYQKALDSLMERFVKCA